MILYIQKFLKIEIEARSVTLVVAQVGSVAMAMPYWVQIARVQDGGWRVSWRWLPGEDLNEEEIRNSCGIGPAIRGTLRRVEATKPWSVE